MNRWAIYLSENGAIDRIYSGPYFDALLQVNFGEGVVAIEDGLDDSTAFIQSGTVLPVRKAPLPIQVSRTEITADGNDTLAITSVPVGTRLQWPDGQVDEINDGTVELSTDLAGTYTLKFSAVQYLDQEVTIEAVAAA